MSVTPTSEWQEKAERQRIWRDQLERLSQETLNRHAWVGMGCLCLDCFCCAAMSVVAEQRRARLRAKADGKENL